MTTKVPKVVEPKEVEDRADTLAQVLGRVAKERAQEQATALEEGEWRASLEAMFTSLIWRTIALALKLKVASPQFDVRTDPVELARRLQRDGSVALETLTPTNAKADQFHKVKTINNVLRGILDIVGALEAYTGADPDEPFFLAVIGTRLGQAEVELALAEEGHWDQVAAWETRKVGSPKGPRKAWRKASAPQIRQWIEESPGISRIELIDKLDKWLDEYIENAPLEERPDYWSLRKCLDGMHAQKLITLNPISKE